MPLVSYAVARGPGAVGHRTPQHTVPLPGNNTIRMQATGIRRRTTPRPGRRAFVGALLALAAARPLPAQRVLGPWDDASIVRPGVLRVGVAPAFATWRERFGRDGGREPLGTDFTLDSLGPHNLPFLAGLGGPLSVLTGLAAPPLTLGALQTRLAATEVTTSIAIDLGLTPRVALQALVPYVKNHVYVTAAPGGAPGATLGLNPALQFAGARTANEAVTTSLSTAAATLTSELARCAGSADASCSLINADRPGAQSLAQQAGQVAGALASVYGTPAVTGSPYAPVAGSALHAAIDARLADLNTRFRSFLGAPASADWVNGRPVAAPPITASDLATVLGDPAFGIAARAFGDFEHSHVGDIEVGAKFLVLDTFGPVQPAMRAGMLRLAVAAAYRLPTGQRDLPDHFADLGAGQQQSDIEVRAFADLALTTRLWSSAVVRYAIQQPDRLVRRITDQPGDPFPELARQQEISRNLGDVLEAEVAPRFVPNDEFSFSALYRYRRKGADAYEGTVDITSADGTPLSLDAATLGAGTETSQQVAGFAVTFSTVRGHARRQARWPLEVSYMHTIVLGGTGVPRAQVNAVGLRVYR